MIMKNHDNESAAGSTITLVSVFMLSCILFILIGYGVDKIIMVSINTAGTMPATQMRYDIIKIMLMIFQIEPFIILIGAGINTWVVSTRSQSGEVDLGGMLAGAAEMVLLTLGMIALVMFGGMALESVINVINNVPFVVTSQIELYSAIIYIGPVFYGLCVLGLLGAVIQYLMLCVQTVDYGTSI
jgi:hypothetical protein